MSNPNLVRKISNNPAGSSGELSPSGVAELSNENKNIIINGNFDFWQRNTTQGVGPAPDIAYKSVDRFRPGGSALVTGVATMSRNTDVPTFTQSEAHSTYSLNIAIGTAQGSFGGAEQIFLSHIIEGYNFKNIYQKKFTLSFWAKSNLTGQRSIAFTNQTDRVYVATYTINQADIWQKIIINVPAPSGGTWNLNHLIGIRLDWSTSNNTIDSTSLVNQWITDATKGTATGNVNLFATIGNYFRISQVMLVAGDVELPFKGFANYYSEELMACQRYYEKKYEVDTIPGTNLGGSFASIDGARWQYSATSVSWKTFFAIEKRTLPTIRAYDSTGNIDRVRANGVENSTNYNIQWIGNKGFYMNNPSASLTEMLFYWTADSEF